VLQQVLGRVTDFGRSRLLRLESACWMRAKVGCRLAESGFANGNPSPRISRVVRLASDGPGSPVIAYGWDTRARRQLKLFNTARLIFWSSHWMCRH